MGRLLSFPFQKPRGSSPKTLAKGEQPLIDDLELLTTEDMALRAKVFVERAKKFSNEERESLPVLLDLLSRKAGLGDQSPEEEKILAQKWSLTMAGWMISVTERAGEDWAHSKNLSRILSQMWLAKLRTKRGSRLNLVAEENIKLFMADLAKKDPVRAFRLNYEALRRVETQEAKGGLTKMDEEHAFAVKRLMESWGALRVEEPSKAMFGTQPLFRRMDRQADLKENMILSWKDLVEDLIAQGQADTVLSHLQRLLKTGGMPQEVSQEAAFFYDAFRPAEPLVLNVAGRVERRLTLVSSNPRAKQKGPFAPPSCKP